VSFRINFVSLQRPKCTINYDIHFHSKPNSLLSVVKIFQVNILDKDTPIRTYIFILLVAMVDISSSAMNTDLTLYTNPSIHGAALKVIRLSKFENESH